jgi:excinuclease ABC subunit C
MVTRPPAGTIPDTPGSYQFKDAQRSRDLRRQGVEPAPAAVELLPGPAQPASAHGADGGDGDERRVDRGAQRGRGAHARVQPHQAAPAAVQRAAARRQELSVPGRHARRAVPACTGDARPQAQGHPLLRPLRARVRHPRDARPAAAQLPDPHVQPGKFNEHHRLGRPCLLYHIEKCSGPCVGEIDEMPYRQLVHELVRLPRRRHRRDRPPARAGHAQRGRRRSSSSGRRACATGWRRCSARSRSSRWSPSATRTST